MRIPLFFVIAIIAIIMVIVFLRSSIPSQKVTGVECTFNPLIAAAKPVRTVTHTFSKNVSHDGDILKSISGTTAPLTLHVGNQKVSLGSNGILSPGLPFPPLTYTPVTVSGATGPLVGHYVDVDDATRVKLGKTTGCLILNGTTITIPP